MMGLYLESIGSRVGPQCILLPGVRAIILNEREEILLRRKTDMECRGLSGSVELDKTALDGMIAAPPVELGAQIIQETEKHANV